MTPELESQEDETETQETEGQDQETETEAITLLEMLAANPDADIEDIMGHKSSTLEERIAAVKAQQSKKLKSETDRRVSQARKKFDREKLEAEVQAQRKAEQKAREDLLMSENKTEELLAERTQQLQESQAELEEIKRSEKVDKLLVHKEVPSEFHDFYRHVTVDSLEELDEFIDGFNGIMEERIKVEVDRIKAELMETGPAPGGSGGKHGKITEPQNIDEQIALAKKENRFGDSLALMTEKENQAAGKRRQRM